MQCVGVCGDPPAATRTRGHPRGAGGHPDSRPPAATRTRGHLRPPGPAAVRVTSTKHGKCVHPFFNRSTGRFMNCNNGLFGDDFIDALQLLQKHYTDFLSQGSKARSAGVYSALRLAPGNDAKLSKINLPTRKMIQYLVPDANSLLPPRQVCRETFLLYWPISSSTLKRVIGANRTCLPYRCAPLCMPQLLRERIAYTPPERTVSRRRSESAVSRRPRRTADAVAVRR